MVNEKGSSKCVMPNAECLILLPAIYYHLTNSNLLPPTYSLLPFKGLSESKSLRIKHYALRIRPTAYCLLPNP